MVTTDTATAATYEKGQLYQLPLADLLADPRQPRKVIDAQALEELTASVNKVGVIQPIVFRVDPSGSHVVVAGERRVAAARKAGLTEILSLNKLPQEVRDDCRGDRSITRATLIAIAKKKQARAMTTAYTAFKAKQQKGKTTRTKKDANAYDTVSGLVGKAMKRLSALDTADWADTDMETFRAALLGLKEWIDAFLAPPAETPAATKTKKTTQKAT